MLLLLLMLRMRRRRMIKENGNEGNATPSRTRLMMPMILMGLYTSLNIIAFLLEINNHNSRLLPSPALFD
jgi:hypothetical protein